MGDLRCWENEDRNERIYKWSKKIAMKDKDKRKEYWDDWDKDGKININGMRDSEKDFDVKEKREKKNANKE